MTIKKVYCISGIDTDIGKSIATGLLARSFLDNGINAITQKIAQTGCAGISEDILTHRKLMDIEIQEVDRRGISCPYVFPVPCSPHLAARLAGDRIDCQKIEKATRRLLREYEVVLLEGAGGLSVPLTEETTFLDYLEKRQYPLIVVTSPRLGSINHTLNVLELARYRGIELVGLIYNLYQESDPRIAKDTKRLLQKHLQRYFKGAGFGEMIDVKQYNDSGLYPDLYSSFFTRRNRDE